MLRVANTSNYAFYPTVKEFTKTTGQPMTQTTHRMFACKKVSVRELHEVNVFSLY